jgi:hypothetical protein
MPTWRRHARYEQVARTMDQFQEFILALVVFVTCSPSLVHG